MTKVRTIYFEKSEEFLTFVAVTDDLNVFVSGKDKKISKYDTNLNIIGHVDLEDKIRCGINY